MAYLIKVHNIFLLKSVKSIYHYDSTYKNDIIALMWRHDVTAWRSNCVTSWHCDWYQVKALQRVLSHCYRERVQLEELEEQDEDDEEE